MHFATYNAKNREGDADTLIYFLAQTKNLKGEVAMKNRDCIDRRLKGKI